jgi:altronate hydrolase
MTAILLSPNDNVAIANAPLDAGFVLPGGVTASGQIDLGHKVAVKHIAMGAGVIKYGQVIGRATIDIQPGDHVHSHNLVFDKARSTSVSQSTAVPRRRRIVTGRSWDFGALTAAQARGTTSVSLQA